MRSLKKKYLDSRLDYKFIYCLTTVLLLALPLVARAQTVVDYSEDLNEAEQIEEFFDFSGDLLILEPVVQGFNLDEYAYVSEALKEDGRKYIPLSQMASYLGIKFERNNGEIVLWYADDENVKYKIDLNGKRVFEINDKGDVIGEGFWFRDYDLEIIDQSIFFSSGFWSKLLEADVVVDTLNMQLKIDREKDFPTIAKLKAEKQRNKKGIHTFKNDSITNYEFDNRMFSSPVVDLSLGKGWGHHKSVHKTTNSDSYSVNLAMLAMGLDVNAYVYGSSYNDRKPTVRLSGSRTFLDEPENKLKLKTLKVGDISGVGQSYFANASYGRGIAVSSFKNLVMSANKTIDLTGPLTPGWEVELYWNNQLIGYRQSGANGEYNFPDIPVSYGLNTFKLVFFGPYGETRTEYERYYSGTSPVKTGEFGYNISAFQPYRYLIEENRDFTYEGNDTPVIDTTFYYGATDRLTLMGGFTQTPDETDNLENQHFGMAGAQVSLSGSSIQYNLEQNLDTAKFGHHLEWQGDVYIGNIYAGYDKYNGIHSPVSLYGDEYLDEQLEMRLSGILPYSLPYYLSYRVGTLEDGSESFENLSARLSKQLTNGLNLSLEDNWYSYGGSRNSYNTLRAGLYKWWNKWTLQSYLTYKTNPDPEFTEILTRLDWRAGRNTYLSSQWTRNLINDMDYFSLSGGHVYPFGGLTATLETDRDLNLSAYLTYNVSFAKEPDNVGVIVNSNSKLSNTGTMFVKVKDETGAPIEGVGLNANGLEKMVYTDENGVAVLSDLQTYEKTILSADMETLIDIALTPENEYKKVVLRPGTVKEVEYNFIHRGAIEGKIANPLSKRLFGYQIIVLDKDNKQVAETFADLDGFFILDGIKYGTYDVIISKDGNTLTQLNDITIDDVVVYIDEEITVDLKALDYFEKSDSVKEQEKFMDEHEKGYNPDEYKNKIFPIDIEKDIFDMDPQAHFVSVSEIEEGVFEKTIIEPKVIHEKIIKENDEVGRSEIISPDIAPEESMLQKIEDEIFAPKNKCTIIKRVNGVVVDVIKPGEERPVENIDERLISVEGTREAVEIDAETLDELIEQLTVDKK